MSRKSNRQPVVAAAVKAASAEAIGLALTRNPIVAIATAVTAELLGMLNRPHRRGRSKREPRPGGFEARAKLRRSSGQAPQPVAGAGGKEGSNHG